MGAGTRLSPPLATPKLRRCHGPIKGSDLQNLLRKGGLPFGRPSLILDCDIPGRPLGVKNPARYNPRLISSVKVSNSITHPRWYSRVLFSFPVSIHAVQDLGDLVEAIRYSYPLTVEVVNCLAFPGRKT